MAESRFNQKKANLRAYLRKRGAKIDTSRKTVSVDVDSLNWKEMERLKELERWGYKVNEGKIPPPATLRFDDYEVECESFIEFADEIISQYS